ncbi:4Fe-4S dicluster domain-containing protein [candidate division KSB1 bacterium]|nr:4Fe-4S dicluster domain-containing protein [candidate division KSB1 bacterium]
MHIKINDKPVQGDQMFRKEVLELSHAHIERCYQCYTCALGCPVAFATDFTPNQIIRMVLAGMKEQVLQSELIWMCASCETCAARCPNDVEIVKLMDTLRIMSLKGKPGKSVKDIPFMHKVFLKIVENCGRIYELGFIMGMKAGNPAGLMNVKALVEDGILGFKMFKRRKLAILPHRAKGWQHVQQMIKKIQEKNQSQEQTK